MNVDNMRDPTDVLSFDLVLKVAFVLILCSCLLCLGCGDGSGGEGDSPDGGEDFHDAAHDGGSTEDDGTLTDLCDGVDCDDGDPCTTDYCVEGECRYDPIPGCGEPGECLHFDDICPLNCTPMNDADCVGPPPTPIDATREIMTMEDYDTVIYIDPDHSSPGDGSSPDSPLSSWSDVSFEDGVAYVQKRSTEDTQMSGLTIGADDVLVGAYGDGDGDRPIVSGPVNVVGDEVTVRDLEIIGGVLEINHPSPHPYDTVLFNNRVSGAPIVSAGYHSRILNNEVFNAPTDGIFVQYAHDFEIAGNYVHHINQLFHENTSEDVASGDSIQLVDSANWWVHHNILDRSDTGNKFCFIATTSFPDMAQFGTLEYNYFTGPLITEGGGASVFLGGEPELVHVRFNVFSGPSPSALYKHSLAHFYGNVVVGTNAGVISAGNDTYIYNNVFMDISGSVLSGGGIYSFNNIFEAPGSMSGIAEEGNNLFVSDYSLGEVFVDAHGGDYRPVEGGPGVDAGSWQVFFTDSFTQDALGTDVPQDDTIDIGAFQF